MWLLIGFFVHHLYSAWLMSEIERNGTLESIFSGYKFVPEAILCYPRHRYDPASERVEKIAPPRRRRGRTAAAPASAGPAAAERAGGG